MGFTDKDVAYGRRLVAELGERKWQLGELALKVVPNLKVGGFHSPDHDQVLIRFADKIGVPHPTLWEYRRMAQVWPAATRVPDISYSMHRVLMGNSDREAVLKAYMASTDRPSYRELQRYVGRNVSWQQTEQLDKTIGQMDAAERTKVAARLLESPAVMEAVLADRKVHKRISASMNTKYRKRATSQPEPKDLASMLAALARAENDLLHAVQAVPVPPEDQESLRDAAKSSYDTWNAITEIIDGKSNEKEVRKAAGSRRHAAAGSSSPAPLALVKKVV